MEVATSANARRYSVASSNTSTDYEGASIWSDGASLASSPGTSYSSSFGRSPPSPSIGRRRASTCVSAQLDATTRLQPLSEQIEEIQETAINRVVGFSDSPAPPLGPPFELESFHADQSRPGIAKRLLSGTRARAVSIGKLQFTRPKLERREAGPNGLQEDDEQPSPGSRTPSIFRSKPFRQLKGRFAYSAPVTPLLTPSVSTDKVHLFHSRPSSIVLRGTGSDLQASFYFDAVPGSPLLDSANASIYAPAMDNLASCEETAVADEAVEEEPKNLFDGLLPREIRVLIFAKVVENSMIDQASRLARGGWSAKIARETRWSGEAAGLRTLVLLSRVSQEWREMAFDGQLWQDVTLARTLGSESMGIQGMKSLAQYSGSHLRKLDLRGFRDLQNEDLDALTVSCCAGRMQTNLQYIDLTGQSHVPCNDFMLTVIYRLSRDHNQVAASSPSP